MSEIPVFQHTMNPLLAVLRESPSPLPIEEIDRRVIARMALPAEVLGIPHEADKPDRSEVAYRIAWARTWLKKSGHVINPRRGQWTVTELGRTAAAARREVPGPLGAGAPARDALPAGDVRHERRRELHGGHRVPGSVGAGGRGAGGDPRRDHRGERGVVALRPLVIPRLVNLLRTAEPTEGRVAEAHRMAFGT